jgi:hypothetical protein
MILSCPVALVGCALLLATAVLAPFRARGQRNLIFLAAFLSAFVPVKGLPIAGYIRGFTGDLSVATLVLLSTTSLSWLRDKELFDRRSLGALMLLVLGSGVVLYPTALGLTYWDAYAMGYGSRAFVAALFLLTMAAWYFDYYLVVLSTTTAALAYSLEVYESSNLWDYLLDPLITLGALAWLCRNRSTFSLSKEPPGSSD